MQRVVRRYGSTSTLALPRVAPAGYVPAVSRYEWSVAGGMPGWRDLVVSVLPACAQLASGPGGGSGTLVAVSTGLACGALVVRRVTPVLALAGTLAAVLLGAGAGAGAAAVGAPVAVLIALHALAVNRTAGFALAGSATATLVAAGTAAVLGEPIPSVRPSSTQR